MKYHRKSFQLIPQFVKISTVAFTLQLLMSTGQEFIKQKCVACVFKYVLKCKVMLFQTCRTYFLLQNKKAILKTVVNQTESVSGSVSV